MLPLDTPVLLVLTSVEGCYATVGPWGEVPSLLEALLLQDLAEDVLEQHREDYLDHSLAPEEAPAHQHGLPFLFYVLGQEESAAKLAAWEGQTPFTMATELDYFLTVSLLPTGGVLDVYGGVFQEASPQEPSSPAAEG